MTSETAKQNISSFIRTLVTSRFLWLGIVLYSLYWLAVPFVPKEPLLNAVAALVLIGGLAIFATWLPAFVMGIMTGARIGAWQLPVGIFLTWLGLQERGAWTLVWRFVGQPDWMLNHHFTGQANWMIFLSAFLYLIAPGNETGEVPVKNWWLVGVVLAIASFAAGVVFTALVLQPAA